MTDALRAEAYAAVNAYAASRQEVIVGGDPPKTHLQREPMAPKAFAALRAVLDRCEWMDAMIAEYKPYELAAFVREGIVKALEEA